MSKASDGAGKINGTPLSPAGSTTPPAAAGVGRDDVGVHINGTPWTTDMSRMVEEDFIVDPVDKVIVKQMQSGFPIDQICRYIPSSAKTSMRYEYYSIDEKPIEDTITTGNNSATAGPVDIVVSDISMWSKNDTIFVKTVRCKAKGTGTDTGDEPLRLFVTSVNRGAKKLSVFALNAPLESDGVSRKVPVIPNNTKCYRMAPAMFEGDMQGNIFTAMPTKKERFMQIFKTQVAQSTIQKMSSTEVPFDIDDQTEIALRNLRRDIEVAYIFGAQSYTYDSDKDRYVYTCGGIIEQMMDGGHFIEYDPAALAKKEPEAGYPAVGENYLLKNMVQPLFIGNSGSPKRYGFFGSDIVTDIAVIPGVRKQLDARQIERKYGVDWKTIGLMTWQLDMYQHPLLDEFGMSHCAIILDLVYVQKAIFRSLSQDVLDLKKAGVFDGDSLVWTEISSINLKYPETHGMWYISTEFEPLIVDEESSSN